jgi:serine protease Do
MKCKSCLSLTVLALISLGVGAHAQSTPAAPPAPAPPAVAYSTTFFDDSNFLGVHVEDVTRETAARYNMTGEPRGVGIKEIIKGSPAERAGLHTGDVIVRFDGETVTSVRKLTRLIEESAPEHAARLTISRNGSEQEVSATLARRDSVKASGDGDLLPGFDVEGMKRLGEELGAQSEEWKLKGDEMRERLEDLQRKYPGGVFTLGSSRRIGVSTSTLSRQLADYFGVAGGVLVSSVESNSPAERAGLKAGDIITEADGKKIEDVGDLVSALNRKDDGEVSLTVVRDKKQRNVRVAPEKRQPQGRLLTPGAFSIEAPIAAITLPSIRVAPRAVVAPNMRIVGPRVHITPPRVRVIPSRIRAFGRGEAIL